MENNKYSMKCKRCGYEWMCGSKFLLVSCPYCGIKNKTPRGQDGDTTI